MKEFVSYCRMGGLRLEPETTARPELQHKDFITTFNQYLEDNKHIILETNSKIEGSQIKDIKDIKVISLILIQLLDIIKYSNNKEKNPDNLDNPSLKPDNSNKILAKKLEW